MKKLFTILVALCATTALVAADFEENGIAYNILGGDSVAVTSNSPKYSGNITIPTTVTYQSKTYRVTSIGWRAFAYCDSLASVTIGNSVTSIGDGAFYECYSIASVTIPNSVTSIGWGAFVFCTSLTSITIPNSVTSIGNGAFYYCYSLASIAVDASNKQYSSEDGVLFTYAKDSLIQYPIGNSRTTYTIPNSVTSVGDGAFYKCTSIASVTIPNSVTSVGSSAFSGCTSLPFITIPNSVTRIGDYAFDECSSFTSVTIPNSVTSIGNGVFAGCASLTSVTIPNSVTSIGEDAFKECTSLTSITIPNSVKSIGYSAFHGCDSLASVTIPNSVTSIGDHAFSFCNSLASVTIGNSVTSIGESAFYYCYSLISVTIPNSVKSIGNGAFYGCNSLASIAVDASNKQYSSEDGVLFTYAKDSLIQYPIGNSRTTYTIPNSVTSIGEDAFSACTSLTSITIPNSVTSIGDDAFKYCDSLTSVNIPTSVTSIGNGAFYYCYSLASITCEATTPPTCGSSCFYNVYKTIPLYVPAGSITAYQGASGWKDFTNIQAIMAQEVFVTEIESEPTSTSVEIAWPAVSGSDNYTIEVKQGSKVICTIIFNAQGQLLSINFPTAAPARGIANAQEAVATATGWAYTINGLTPGTAYTYSVVAKDAGGNVLDTKNGSFETTTPTAVENVNDNGNHNRKVMRNGQFLIEKDGKTYNITGARVE